MTILRLPNTFLSCTYCLNIELRRYDDSQTPLSCHINARPPPEQRRHGRFDVSCPICQTSLESGALANEAGVCQYDLAGKKKVGFTHGIDKCPKNIQRSLQDNPVKPHHEVQLLVSISREDDMENGHHPRQTQAHKHESPIRAPRRGAEVVKPRDHKTPKPQQQNLHFSQLNRDKKTHENASTYRRQIDRHQPLMTKQAIIQRRHIAPHDQKHNPRVI